MMDSENSEDGVPPDIMSTDGVPLTLCPKIGATCPYAPRWGATQLMPQVGGHMALCHMILGRRLELFSWNCFKVQGSLMHVDCRECLGSP